MYARGEPTGITRAMFELGCCGKLKKGAVGVAKSSLGVGLTSRETRRVRRAICDECNKKKGGFCVECGCNIVLKTRLKREKCELMKWKSEE